jgi:hypothetical protein
MKKLTIKFFAYAVFFALFIIACAGTRLTDTWVDEAHRAKPVSNILVIGLTYKENEEIRRSFEDNFVAQLKEAGVEAISSVDAISIPADLRLDKEEILKAIKKSKSDSVIITHLVGKESKEVQTYIPGGPYGGYYGYYRWAYGIGHGHVYSSTHKSVRLATNLYDAKTEKLIWSGKSKTSDPESIKKTIRAVIKVVIEDLQKNNLLPQK